MAALARTVPYRTRIGVAAQWASPVAVGLRNIALRLLPFIVRPLSRRGPGPDRA